MSARWSCTPASQPWSTDDGCLPPLTIATRESFVAKAPTFRPELAKMPMQPAMASDSRPPRPSPHPQLQARLSQQSSLQRATWQLPLKQPQRKRRIRRSSQSHAYPRRYLERHVFRLQVEQQPASTATKLRLRQRLQAARSRPPRA